MLKKIGLNCAAAIGLVAIATPTLAEAVLLDCDVTARSDSDYRGSVATESRAAGTWRFRLNTDTRRVTLEQAPFLFRVAGMSELPIKVREEVVLNATEDAYGFCLARTGPCGQQTVRPQGDWYTVNGANIDRRRGTFQLTIETYRELLQGGATYTYSGTCQRAPEQQF